MKLPFFNTWQQKGDAVVKYKVRFKNWDSTCSRKGSTAPRVRSLGVLLNSALLLDSGDEECLFTIAPVTHFSKLACLG